MKHTILFRLFSPADNENGSAIVIAMLVLIAVTIIGIATSRMSTTEQMISGNDIVKKISYFNSDAGVFGIPKVISMALNEKKTPFLGVVSPFTYKDTGTLDMWGGSARTFYRELAGFNPHDDEYDVSFSNDGVNQTEIDVERLGAFTLTGGGAEFSAGLEGQGTSLKGIRFGQNSFGHAQKNALTQIQARYLKVLGTAGGL